jgi:undecaprenyl-diphosphatase
MGQRRAHDFLDASSVAASQLARGGFVWVGAGALAAWQQKDRGVFFETAAATWLADGLALGASHIVGRKRPCETRRRPLVECPQSPSFPSKHAAAAFAGVLALSRDNAKLRTLTLPAAVAVAASRVRTGVHYPTDVIAGAVLGAVVARAIRPYFASLD